MASMSLEQRVKKLESQVGELRDQLRTGAKSKDWRRTIGAFTDDDAMQEILRDAMRLRDADRKKARRKTTVKRKTQR
jgi:hypothetical protein